MVKRLVTTENGNGTGGRIFNKKEVRSAKDLPDEILEVIQDEFPGTVKFKGEIPTEGGNVTVGQTPPPERWDKRVHAIIDRFHGQLVAA